MAPVFHRDRFTWLAYLLLAFYGFFLNSFGPITPFLKDEFKLSYTVSSLHFTAFAVGILLVGLSGHVVIRRLGRVRALWLGAFGISASAFVLVAGRSVWVTIGASFCMGLVGSLILAVVPSALSDQHGHVRGVALSEANLVASLVATSAPLLVGWSAHLPGGWRWALGTVALAPLVMRFGFARVTIPESASLPEDAASERRPLPRSYWVLWAALVLAVSVEFCMIFWSANYLETSLGVQRVHAAQAISLFLAGMIVGRLAGSRLVRRFSTRGLVIASILVASAGFVMFLTAAAAALGLVGLFVTGLGVASLYPLIVSLAIGAAENNTMQAGSRATLASGTAILALPLALGRLADTVGIRPAFGVVGVLLFGILLIMLAVAKRTRPCPKRV